MAVKIHLNSTKLRQAIAGKQRPLKRARRAGVAAAILVLILIIITVPLLPAALACGGCEVNYPFLHSFPSEEELAQATAHFFEEYSANMLQRYEQIKIEDKWHIKLEKPGIKDEYDTIEVILCFKEELTDNGITRVGYHFTMLAEDAEGGYYFWPYSMGSFEQREGLDAYIEEYVVSRLKDQRVVEAPGSGSSQAGQTPANRGFLNALFILLGLTLISFGVRRRIGRKKGFN